jgi:hypothetical protein
MAGRERLLELRVATGAPDQKLASGIWRIWQGKNNNDIYVAPRPVAGAVKVSLHANGYCYCGFTKQFQNVFSEMVTMCHHAVSSSLGKGRRHRITISLALRSAASKPSVTRLDNASGRGHEDAPSVARRRMEKT